MASWNDACLAAVMWVTETPLPDPTFRNLYEAGEFEAMGRLAYRKQYKNPVEIASILVRKQRDYGHGNIMRFGRDGVLVRLWDKVARYENLTKDNETHEASPEFETVEDTLLDIIGYVTILKMLEAGTFTLEVE